MVTKSPGISLGAHMTLTLKQFEWILNMSSCSFFRYNTDVLLKCSSLIFRTLSSEVPSACSALSVEQKLVPSNKYPAPGPQKHKTLGYILKILKCYLG